MGEELFAGIFLQAQAGIKPAPLLPEVAQLVRDALSPRPAVTLVAGDVESCGELLLGAFPLICGELSGNGSREHEKFQPFALALAEGHDENQLSQRAHGAVQSLVVGDGVHGLLT